MVLEVEVQMKYKRLVHNLRELDQPGHRSIYLYPTMQMMQYYYIPNYLLIFKLKVQFGSKCKEEHDETNYSSSWANQHNEQYHVPWDFGSKAE